MNEMKVSVINERNLYYWNVWEENDNGGQRKENNRRNADCRLLQPLQRPSGPERSVNRSG